VRHDNTACGLAQSRDFEIYNGLNMWPYQLPWPSSPTQILHEILAYCLLFRRRCISIHRNTTRRATNSTGESNFHTQRSWHGSPTSIWTFWSACSRRCEQYSRVGKGVSCYRQWNACGCAFWRTYPIQLPGVILLRPYLSGAVAYAKLSSAEQRAALYACAQGNFAACGSAIGKVYKNRDQKL